MLPDHTLHSWPGAFDATGKCTLLSQSYFWGNVALLGTPSIFCLVSWYNGGTPLLVPLITAFSPNQDIIPAIISCFYCIVNFPLSTGLFLAAKKHVIVYLILKKQNKTLFASYHPSITTPFLSCVIFRRNLQSSSLYSLSLLSLIPFFLVPAYLGFYFDNSTGTVPIKTTKDFHFDKFDGHLLVLIILSRSGVFDPVEHSLSSFYCLSSPNFHCLYSSLLTGCSFSIWLPDSSTPSRPQNTGVMQGSDLFPSLSLNTFSMPLTTKFIPLS